MLRQMHIIGLRNIPICTIVDARNLMHLVVYDETLGIEPTCKPAHEQRHHIGLGVAFSEPYAVFKVLETQKLHHQVPLVHHRTVKAGNGTGDRVSHVANQTDIRSGRPRHDMPDEPVYRNTSRRVI